MRTTTLGFVFSFAACAPVGGGGHGPGSGSSGSGSDVAKCDSQVSISGNWTMNANDDLTSDGNDSIPSGCYGIDGSLTISGSNIDTLDKLGDLREVVDLTIDATMLEKIDTPNAIHVTGSLTVNHNDALTDLSKLDFSAGDTLTGVSITFNKELVSLKYVSKIVTVQGPVDIGNNDSLTTLDMSALDRVEDPVDGFKIHDNMTLARLKLAKLTSVTGDFTIQNNPALTSFGSLSLLQYVHGSFVIDNNDALTTMADAMLTPMGGIDGNLQITNNAVFGSTDVLGQAMTSLGQFNHPGLIRGQLQVTDNPQLLYCAAREVGCCVAHGSDVIARNKTSNDSGCAHSWCYAQNGNSCPYQY